MLVWTPVPDPVGMECVCVRSVCVMWTVCVRGVYVCMVLGSVAHLAAGLCPTGLSVVDGCGSSCRLRCDALARRRNV